MKLIYISLIAIMCVWQYPRISPHNDFLPKAVFKVSPIGQSNYGTGFRVTTETGEKFLVTAAHVCKDAKEAAVDLTHTARILYKNNLTDLCLLEDVKELNTITYIMDPKKVIYKKYTYAYSKGFSRYHKFTPKLNNYKVISDKPKLYTKVITLIMEGMALPGNSGAPVLNSIKSRNVMGVITKTNRDRTMAYATSVVELHQLIKDYKNKKRELTNEEIVAKLTHAPIINHTDNEISDEDKKVYEMTKLRCWETSKEVLGEFIIKGFQAYTARCGNVRLWN